MLTFILSGILYLTGVAIILVVRPSTMFTPEGDWKEFGIGKRQDKYTAFPFWLFCLVWALVSYGLVISAQAITGTLTQKSIFRTNTPNTPPVNQSKAIEFEEGTDTRELPKGYYMLNRKAFKLAGVPKYVYLGPEMPS